MKNKLTYKNDWEADQYSIDGKRIRTLNEVEIDKKKFKVTGNVVSIPYSDMGHTYHGISTHYFVTVKLFGINKKIDLNEIVNKKPVYATKFSLEEK
jgi:sporulation protein YlmC with PRC-barrel domain